MDRNAEPATMIRTLADTTKRVRGVGAAAQGGTAQGLAGAERVAADAPYAGLGMSDHEEGHCSQMEKVAGLASACAGSGRQVYSAAGSEKYEINATFTGDKDALMPGDYGECARWERRPEGGSFWRRRPVRWRTLNSPRPRPSTVHSDSR
jgi:hypothetical protein